MFFKERLPETWTISATLSPPQPPLKVNDPTLKYLKLQMTLTILSLIREMSLRTYTFKTATNIYV